MTTNYETAYVTITDHFQAYWAQYAVSVVDPVPELRFWGIEKTALPDDTFVRFSMQPVIEAQSSLRDGNNGQRYTAEGIIFIQIFVPRDNDIAAEILRGLCMVAQRGFRGRQLPGGIWFRQVRVNQLDPENKWYRSNVIAEYRYDEIDNPPALA